MKLRSFEETDSPVICSWIPNEFALYQWSADRIGTFPLNGNELNQLYSPDVNKNNTMIPLTAVDDNNDIIGHILVRYPNKDDKTTVRLGFVIVSPKLRGQGLGKKLLQQAIEYAKENLKANRVTLGVFLNNDKARYCYESVGFHSYGPIEIYKIKNEEWECLEMELLLN